MSIFSAFNAHVLDRNNVNYIIHGVFQVIDSITNDLVVIQVMPKPHISIFVPYFGIV